MDEIGIDLNFLPLAQYIEWVSSRVEKSWVISITIELGVQYIELVSSRVESESRSVEKYQFESMVKQCWVESSSAEYGRAVLSRVEQCGVRDIECMSSSVE